MFHIRMINDSNYRQGWDNDETFDDIRHLFRRKYAI